MTKFEKELTESDLLMIEVLSGYRTPKPYIAACLGISESTLSRMEKHLPAVREARERGLGKASANVYGVAFELATSGKHPAFTAFWLKCMEGWSTTQKIEIIPGGAPMPIDDMNPAERNERIEKLLKVREKLALKTIDVTAKKVEKKDEG